METRTVTSGRRNSRVGITIVAVMLVGAIVVVLLRSPRYRADWSADTWGRSVLVVQLLAVAAAIGGGAFLLVRRPTNRCGLVAMAVGVALGLFYISFFSIPDHGWWLAANSAVTWSLRPLLFWLVLAYPVGRLDRTSRRVYAVFLLGAATTLTLSLLTESDNYPARVFREATWTRLVQSAWWDVSTLVFVAAILIVVQRRRLRFPGASGAAILWAALLAAVAATGGDLVLVASGPLRNLYAHGDGLTPFGSAVQLFDIARWGVVVVILAVAARVSWRVDAAEAMPVELSAGSLGDTLTQALGDPSARVAIVDGRGRWIDGSGTARPAPEPGSGVTFVLSDGVPVAALEHDAELVAHPALIDAAVTALALQLEARRQQTEAEAREAELGALARAVLDAEDDARRSLERDLHDGAQQALVGVTLQVALAARNNGTATEAIADAIDEARAELLRIATGRPPALLAERGLEGALGALVLTAGLPVRVHAEPCADLAPELQRAVWFTAAEAVTNALKHSEATALELSLRRAVGEVTLVVRDNGRGGVTDAPAALRTRVDEVGGALDVQSTPAGTVVRARFAEMMT